LFLKRLEVIGFKSFADRIGIDFVPGVTAVVGPNGSGKSNVTDAIRWVLGEQSAKSLRGAKMEDVIFAGSDSRKPLNFAEVTLILDNSDERLPLDYNEISVTRRVFRSGDSEYLLNKHTCRLKDINDLFMDSGLGKEAFSIISQGRVDEILNSRPEDRRTIFEEAAGVLKYKLRKKKAEHKLFETDDNLHRVLDILHELDDRMEPLQMQASAATDYLRMSEELKDIELGVIAFDLKRIDDRLHELNGQVLEHAENEKQLESVIEDTETQVKNIRINLTDQDTLIDEAQEQLIEASAELERWDGRKQLLAEKRQNTDQQIEKLQLTIQELENEKNELLEELKLKLEGTKKKQEELQKERAELKQFDYILKQSSAEIESEMEEWKTTYIERLNEEATVKNELKHLEQQIVQQKEQTDKMQGENSQISEEIILVEKNKTIASEALSSIQKQLEMKLKQFKDEQNFHTKEKDQLESKQSMLYQAYQHQQQLKARKESLEALEADFSGFFQGVKEILIAREKGHLEGITGAVAELIQVKPKYTKALETALGASMQHIVTESDQHARKAIDYLKEKKMGRATFLPKSVMKSRKLQLDNLRIVLDHPSYIQTADELVSFDESSRIIVENLLGNVIVVKDLQGASQIAKACQYRYRIVTLDGDIINSGGSLTGGFTKQQSSVFSRKAELEELSSKLSQMNETIQQAEVQLAQLKGNMEKRSKQLELMRVDGEDIRSKELEMSANLRELETTFKRLKDREFISHSEKEHVSGRKEELAQKKDHAEQRLNELKTELSQINETINRLSLMKSKSQSERDQLTEQSAQLRSIIAVLTEQVTAAEQSVSDLKLKLERISSKIEQVTKEMSWYVSGDSQSGPSREEISEKLSFWEEKKRTLQFTVSDGKGKRQDIHQKVQQLELQLKKHQHMYKQVSDAHRAAEVIVNRLDVEQSSLHIHLNDQYHLTAEEIDFPEMESFNEDSSRRKVKLLKQSIEELGPVNIVSIEEFERVSERHAFLTEQRQDLLEAKGTLHEAIKEMDEEMSIRFSETFFAIRTQFVRVFRELFGGGQADLVLTNPEEILETGIDIVAQPPGKKLQNLSLLSGGERALTAIALLFAILNIRPVPFCILDEVEAALDESNVVRYSQYLKKFSQDTQFIVITHRKGTMEGADVLYGITMQESGVSKLVSVKLEEEQPKLVAQGSVNA
jgi:chromosome segregation protein